MHIYIYIYTCMCDIQRSDEKLGNLSDITSSPFVAGWTGATVEWRARIRLHKIGKIGKIGKNVVFIS